MNTEDTTPTEPRYKGRLGIVKYGEHKPYGFIDQKSVQPVGDAPPLVHAHAGEGIFLHAYQCDRPLRDGMEVTFAVRPDDKREGCFSAQDARETSDSCLRHLTEGGIQIAVPDRDLQDASVFVTWCIDAKLAGVLKRRLMAGLKVMLLIVQYRLTDDEKRLVADEQRQLVNLDDPMAVLSFNASGKHRILAMLVYDTNESRLHDTYLATTNDGYQRTVLSKMGDRTTMLEDEILGSGCVDVVIPDGLFAKKPRDFDFVNKFFSAKPKDQCAFRRRRLLVYPFQILRVPFMGIVSIVKLMLGALAILALHALGAKVMQYDMFRHPYRVPLKHIWNEVKGSRFDTVEGAGGLLKVIILNPALWGVALIVAVVYAYLFGDAPTTVLSEKGLRSMLVGLTTSVLYISLAFAGIMTAVLAMERFDWAKLGERLDQADVKRQKKKRDARNEANRLEQLAKEAAARVREQELELEVRELICTTTGPRVPDVASLPFTPRTIRFKLIALKRRVCSNFSAA